jgi:hypothetical protein
MLLSGKKYQSVQTQKISDSQNACFIAYPHRKKQCRTYFIIKPVVNEGQLKRDPFGTLYSMVLNQSILINTTRI